MYHLPSKARFSEESLNEEHSLITYHNEKQILYQFYGINLNNNRKESENVEEIFTTEQCVNSSQVKVSFGVSCDDWCLIQQSETWKRLQSFLEETKSKHNQMSLREKVSLVGGKL